MEQVERLLQEEQVASGAWAACRVEQAERPLQEEQVAWGAWAACRGVPEERHQQAASAAWAAWAAWVGDRAAWVAFLRSWGFLIVGVGDISLMPAEHIAIRQVITGEGEGHAIGERLM